MIDCLFIILQALKNSHSKKNLPDTFFASILTHICICLFSSKVFPFVFLFALKKAQIHIPAPGAASPQTLSPTANPASKSSPHELDSRSAQSPRGNESPGDNSRTLHALRSDHGDPM